MAPDIHAATEFANSQGWVRLGASRFTNADRQDIRHARNPGEVVLWETPTEIYRTHHWRELSGDNPDKGWKWDTTMHKTLKDLCDEGLIHIANDIPEPPK